MNYQKLILVIFFTLSAYVGFGQNRGGFTGSAGFMAPRFLPPAITGAPYSGEETQERTQTLSDGTHITQQMMRRTLYRDSLGRTRVERPLMMAPRPNAPQSPTIVEITDPAAGVQYVLDTQNKVAHRSVAQAPPGPNQSRVARGGAFTQVSPAGGVVVGALGGGPVPPPPPPAPNGANSPAFRRPQFSTEKLGTQIIEGILAEGERQTTTIPEGEQGNDRAFNVTTETWTSPDLKMVVLRKTSDPRSGDTIFKMSNLNRSEPDASLFQPPADYTIVDETGQFTISYTN